MIYAALVVGGPLDGQRLAHGSQSYRYVIPTETPNLFYNTAANRIEDVHVSYLGYVYGPVYIDHNNEINLWTPVGQSRLDTLRKLTEGYKP
ncbi:hypothetical protein EV128_12215 [Rhizobium azibense]|nr:hypothetical protein EV128_12215 [Rhizobium azibense]